MITFVGGNGPRNYLFLSQNPDEVRPTGGFIGTYGVLTGIGGKLAVTRYDSIESWMAAHPDAVMGPDERGSPYRYDPGLPQRIANVNTTPDWPQAAEMAARLWARGGEAPVDGVISFSPAFLARILSVMGSVTVDGYDETITSANLVERLDFYTHQQRDTLGTERKAFIAVLAKVVMDRLIEARTSQWASLGKVVADAFVAREAMAWSSDGEVSSVLSARRWDSALPAVAGDFAYPAEFEYAAKNGRSLRRTYQHHVTLRPDGSGTVTTSVRISNPKPLEAFANPAGVLDYVTLYGPQGATLAEGSDPLSLAEPEVAGHPARGWFRPLNPETETTVTIVWDVPHLATQRPDGTWVYSLLWMRLPDHTGDILQLGFDLPDGWRWADQAPPGQVALDHDISGTWALTT
jgi:hypothetical protein